jgi:hypothetical protein
VQEDLRPRWLRDEDAAAMLGDGFFRGWGGSLTWPKYGVFFERWRFQIIQN